MLSKVQVFFVAIFLTLGAVSALPPPQSPCMDGLSALNRRAWTLFLNCRNNMTFSSNKDRLDRAACVTKCILIGDKMLNSKGLVDGDMSENYLKQEVPEILRDSARAMVGPCFTKFANTLDPDDVYCKSYDPFHNCVVGEISKLCDHERKNSPENPMKVITY